MLLGNASGKCFWERHLAKMQNDKSKPEISPLFSPRTLRLLKLSVLVMTVLIAAGLVALVIGMKQQADKLFAKKALETQTLSYALSDGTVFQRVHIGEAGAIWIEGRRADGQIELIELAEDGALRQHIILELRK